jgi:hypothetical protein
LITAAALDDGEREELSGFLRRLMLALRMERRRGGQEGYKPGIS